MKQLLFWCIGMFFISIAHINAQTSYSNNFESPTSGWVNKSSITLDETGGVVTMEFNTKSKWQGQYLNLGSTIDISSNPYATFKVKCDQPAVLTVYVFSESGGNQSVNMKLNSVDEFITLCVDFSSFGDLTEVNAMQWTCNGASTGFKGTLTLDDLELGTTAGKISNIGGIDTQVRYIGSKNQKLLITELDNTNGLSISGGSSFIENASFSPISDGFATLTFDCIDGQSGTAMITITATGSNGYSDNTSTFELTIEDNIAPTINSINEASIENGGTKTIILSGITDGNISVEQPLTISATSNNQTAIPNGNISITHKNGSPYAYLSFSANQAAQDITITVTVDDQETMNNTTSKNISVHVFDNFNNAPTIQKNNGQSVYISDGAQQITLKGISDGDDGSQTLTLKASSNNQSVVNDGSISIEYIEGQSFASLHYSPAGIGDAYITISITDNGDNGSNNGNATTETGFFVSVHEIPPQGYTITFDDFDADTASGELRVERLGTAQIVNYETKDSYETMKIHANGKSIWKGTWLGNFMLDLEENPYVSMDVYADEELLVWLWFWDFDTAFSGNPTRGKRNNSFSTKDFEMVKTVPAGEWTHLVFDFSFPGGMEDINGVPLKTEEIVYILLNWHNTMQTGSSQPPSYTGDIWFANVKIGSDAEGVSVKTPYCTIDNIADQVYIQDASAPQDTILLTGISDGKESISNVNLVTSSSNTAIANPTIIDFQENGTAKLIFTPGNIIGSTTIDIEVSNLGLSYPQNISFNIEIISANTGDADVINIDLGTTHQTFRGFGTKWGDAQLIDAYTKELGASAVRIGLIGNQIEPENDNADPYVLNREALNYSAFDWDYFRQLKANGVETFILSSWSPPAWMKTNRSLSYFTAKADKNQNNKLEKYYYEEYAEMFVAAIAMFKEECDIDIYAVGPQNEPGFCEPYPSAVMTAQEFADLVEVIGKRFEAEGLSTKIIMPEEVIRQTGSWNDYFTTLLADTDAEPYTDVFAVHGYDTDGIGQGSGTAQDWTDIVDYASSGSIQKEVWMTETGSKGNDWVGVMRMAQGMSDAIQYGNLSLWTNWLFSSSSQDYGFYIKGKPSRQFYAAKNFYKFIKPGALRVDNSFTDSDLMVSSFQNDIDHGGHLAIVIVNNAETAKTITLNILGGAVPSNFEIYRTTKNDPCVKLDNLDGSELIPLPALSITTIYGLGETYTLTIENGKGDGQYASGSEVIISADAPATDYEFLEWTGSNVSAYLEDPSAATTKVYMPANDYTVTATYKLIKKYDLSVYRGSGSGSYNPGETILISADAAHVDSVFNGWIGDVSYISNRLSANTSITMPEGGATVTATYRSKNIATYKLTVTDGTIDNTNGLDTASLVEGAIVGITANIIANKIFNGWTGDISNLDDASSASANLIMPASAVNITASYTQLYDLAITNGTIKSNGQTQGKFYEGDVITIIASDQGECNEFDTWSGDISGLNDATNVEAELTMPLSNVSLTADFSPKNHEVILILKYNRESITDANITLDSISILSDQYGMSEFNVPNGTYSFSVTSNDFEPVSGNITIPCSDTSLLIPMVPSEVTKVTDLEQNVLRIYPNPTTNFINIVSPYLGDAQIEICDITGKVMLNEYAPSNAGHITLDVSNLSKGIYLINVMIKDGKYNSILSIQ